MGVCFTLSVVLMLWIGSVNAPKRLVQKYNALQGAVLNKIGKRYVEKRAKQVGFEEMD